MSGKGASAHTEADSNTRSVLIYMKLVRMVVCLQVYWIVDTLVQL